MSEKFLVRLKKYLDSLTDEERQPFLVDDAAAHLEKVNPELYLEYEKYFDEYAREKGWEKEDRDWEKNRSDFLWNTIREAIFWGKSMDLEWMYTRVMRLSAYVTNVQYFKRNDHGEVSIPDRNQVLVKLRGFADELLFKIYPEIEKFLTHKSDMVEINTQSIRGKIDWNKTILKTIQHSDSFPIDFICQITKQKFDNPENILLLISVFWLNNYARWLLGFRNLENFSPDEIQKIRTVIRRSESILSQTPLRSLIELSKKYSTLSPNSSMIKNLQIKLKERIQGGILKNLQVYEKLNEWIYNFINFNVQRYSASVQYNMDRVENVNTMYEIWILLEIVSYLRRKGIMLVPTVEESYEKGRPEIKNFKSDRMTVFYEQHIQAQTVNYLNPDFLVCIGEPKFKPHQHKGKMVPLLIAGNIPLLIDPKNWHKKPLNEVKEIMMKYLVELNHPFGISTACAIHPREDKESKEPEIIRTRNTSFLSQTIAAKQEEKIWAEGKWKVRIEKLVPDKKMNDRERDQIFDKIFEDVLTS